MFKKIKYLICLLFISIFVLSGCKKTSNDEMYKITFNSNGGSIVETIEIKAGEAISKPSNPTKEGYEFVGWYTDSLLTDKFNFSTEIASDITLHAKWEDPLRPEFSESSKVAFSLFGLDVAWYAVIILSGALLVAFYGYFFIAKKLKLSTDDVVTGVTLGLFFGILGARLYYVIFSASAGENYNGILDVLNMRDGGLAIHGGVIATVIFLPIYCKVKKIKLLYALEIVMPLVMLAQVVGRWGNFVNQEAFGGLVEVEGLDLDALTKYAVLSDEILQAQRDALSKLLVPDFIIDRMYIRTSSADGFICAGYYYPTFYFESILNFVGATAYLILRKYIKQIKVGDGISFYLIWYGVVRIFIESMRTDPLMLGNTGIKVAILISIVCIVIGVGLIVARRIMKYQLIPCGEALYAEGSSMMYDGYVPKETEPGIIAKLVQKIKDKKQDNKGSKNAKK